VALRRESPARRAQAEINAVNLKSLQWILDRNLSRLRDGGRKVAWRIRHASARGATPVFIFGSQRSGTGMLGSCLGHSPQFENLGESDQRAFSSYSLRDIGTVRQLIRDCPYRYIVLKPLKDSHRVRELLDLEPAGKALWAFRSYLDRVNSAVRQFGRHPLSVFQAMMEGRTDAWQLQGMSSDVERVLRSVRVSELTAHDGAALMWWVRNSLFFSQSLAIESRVRLWSYDRFVKDPETELRIVLEFLGGQFSPYMLDGVHGHSIGKEEQPALRSDIASLCASLYERLLETSARAPA